MELVRFDSTELATQVACDELLLRRAETGQLGEMLRIYEARSTGAVIGIGGRCRSELRLDACRAAGLPIVRRCSGGGTVLVGRGCLLYSLILDMRSRPALRTVRESYRRLLPPLADALSTRDGVVQHAGLSDLAIGDRKIGGSAQKRGQHFVLHHGTLLYDFPPDLMDRYLGDPPDAPAYRRERSHSGFVTNLALSKEDLARAVRSAYAVDGPIEARDLTHEMETAVADLTARKYGRDEWTYRR